MNKMIKEKKVNVAEESTNGHFVEGADTVVKLGMLRDQVYLVKGPSLLTTENHTSLKMEEDCIITPQRIYSSVQQAYKRVMD